ncbi:MAG: hypothetical protein LAP85_17175 [Acidobacteriia bacterium]|nr:hypothetical protein [Terriglobia bacterium]
MRRGDCSNNQALYAKKVKAVAEAALKLAECAQQEREFRESLTDAGVMLIFETLPFNWVGYTRERYGNANIYNRQAKKAGCL